MAGRIASQAPFILLPRYGEKYEGMAKQIKDVIGVARQQARTPEELAFAEYVATNTVGARMGRAINKRQVNANGGRPILKGDEYFGAGSTIDPFLLPYKSGYDRTINDYLSSGVVPYKEDAIEKLHGIDYQDRLASIAHIPKMMERWENLPKVEDTVYRGNSSNYGWYTGQIAPSRFVSASQDKRVARAFADMAEAKESVRGQLVAINSKTGRRIASRDNEEEVLFAPNAVFASTPDPIYRAASEKYLNGEPITEQERQVLAKGFSTTYSEIASNPMPVIPSYKELKEISPRYASIDKRWNELRSYEKDINVGLEELNYYDRKKASEIAATVKQGFNNAIQSKYDLKELDNLAQLLSQQQKILDNIF